MFTKIAKNFINLQKMWLSFGTTTLSIYNTVLLSEEAKEHTGSNSRTDYTSHIGTHSVHQQIV